MHGVSLVYGSVLREETTQRHAIIISRGYHCARDKFNQKRRGASALEFLTIRTYGTVRYLSTALLVNKLLRIRGFLLVTA